MLAQLKPTGPGRRTLAAFPAQSQRAVRGAPGLARSGRLAVAVLARHGRLAHPGRGRARRRPRRVRRAERCQALRRSRCVTSTATASVADALSRQPERLAGRHHRPDQRRRPRHHPDAASRAHVPHAPIAAGRRASGARTRRGCGCSATRGGGSGKGANSPDRRRDAASARVRRCMNAIVDTTSNPRPRSGRHRGRGGRAHRRRAGRARPAEGRRPRPRAAPAGRNRRQPARPAGAPGPGVRARPRRNRGRGARPAAGQREGRARVAARRRGAVGAFLKQFHVCRSARRDNAVDVLVADPQDLYATRRGARWRPAATCARAVGAALGDRRPDRALVRPGPQRDGRDRREPSATRRSRRRWTTSSTCATSRPKRRSSAW